MTSATTPDPHRIHLHHIGGRDGEVGGFPLNPSFADDVHLHIYDADPSCLAQIEEVNGKRGHSFSVYDCVLADAERSVEFHVTYDPCGSSIRRPKRFADAAHIKSPLFGDYLLTEAFSPFRTASATATTLDAWARGHHVPVDVISVDTQGTEDLVLHGAKESLRRSAVAVVAEVSFVEAYEGQPLFGDICKLMQGHGFDFIRLLNGRREDTSRFRGPIGWRGRSGTFFDDAIFLRHPEHVEAQASDPTASLLKLAYIALSFGDLERTIECLRRVSERSDADHAFSHRAYPRFLMEIWQIYEQEDHVWMAKFTELFDLEESLARFEPNILHYWNIYDIHAARRRYFASNDREAFCRRARELLDEAPSALERLLLAHGFEAQATDFGHRRRKDMEAVARMLHCLHHLEPTDALNLSELSGAELLDHRCSVRRR